MSTQTRNLNLDLIKIIAMFFVVGLHTGTSFIVNGVDVNNYYRITICGTAIPLFFTVSGYLLLGRPNVNWHYSIKKIWGIVRFVFVVCWIHWLIMFAITQEPHFDKLYKDPLGAFLMGGAFWQFWYFGAMCILYLLYPLLNKVYCERPKLFNSFLGVLVVICSMVYVMNVYTPGTFEEKIPQSLRIWNWLMYFCLGGLIKKYCKAINTIWFWVAILAILYCVQLVWASSGNPIMLKSDYNFSSPITLLYIAVFFISLNKLNTDKMSKGIQMLSPLFLPVYTLHPFFIYPTQDFRHSFHATYPIYWALITIATVVTSYLIMKTRVGKWVFRI
jgi:surface polysaccharide O-acyltransferase-like enzyme